MLSSRACKLLLQAACLALQLAVLPTGQVLCEFAGLLAGTLPAARLPVQQMDSTIAWSIPAWPEEAAFGASRLWYVWTCSHVKCFLMGYTWLPLT